MTGRVILDYEVLHKLGSGGMGVVYKARDTKLSRHVAIKFLPPSLVNDPMLKERLLREARAASALDHRNICTIHHVGETEEGELFLVMAYYEGETLAERIRRGPLPVEQAIELARQLLEGLGHAHECGIIHRDIKPANVMVTRRNEVKILDFGLAKLVDQAALTETGGLMGTVAYMSPEQATGLEADLRSDIWSSGVVFYEMLAGERPFHRPNAPAILSAILRDQPRPILELRRDLPPATARIIEKALAKSRGERYQAVGEFLRDLALLSTLLSEGETVVISGLVAAPPQQSIVILPIVNLSRDNESEYFSDGLTDEIISDISSVPALRVISRTSAMRLKGVVGDIQKIAAELNVRYVLEGSVQRSGSQLRMNAKLIDAASDAVVWAEKYSGTLEDVFAIQAALSRKIVEGLRVKLNPAEEKRLASRPIPNVQAFEYYLKAKQEIYRYSEESLNRAIEYLERGMEIVGENALLLYSLGMAYWQFVNAGIRPDRSYLEKARECAAKVLELDPESPCGYRLQGMVLVHEGRNQEAIRFLKKALERDPNDPDGLAWLSSFYGLSGRPYLAAPLVKKLLEIDPLTPVFQCMPGFLALMAGEFGRALEPFAKGLKMEPENAIIRMTHGQILALNGRREEALGAFDALARDLPESFFAKLGIFYRHALAGDRERAQAAVTEELKGAARADPQYCWNMAECFALLNEREAALDWLEESVGLGFLNYPLVAMLDPFLENVRRESRFERLMIQMRERWEALEV
jgi:eukaryotic-like serine/threonine-protein kinase